MKLSKRIKCLVYLLYAYLIFLTICATVLSCLGGYVLYHQLAYQPVIQSYAWVPTAVIVGIGLAKYLICYFGWRATAHRNRCLISLFCTSLFLLIMVQIALAVWTLLFRQEVHLESRGYVYQSFNAFIESGQITDQNHIWNRMQGELKCCGAHGISDFSELSIPWSCYNRPAPGAVGRQFLYDRGCLNVLVEDIKWQLLVISFSAMGLCVVQIYGIFCTWHLVQLLKAAKKANNAAATLQRQQSKREKQIELLPFATAPYTHSSSTTSPTPSTSKGAISKNPIHETIQQELKRATAERMSRRQMSQKSQMNL